MTSASTANAGRAPAAMQIGAVRLPDLGALHAARNQLAAAHASRDMAAMDAPITSIHSWWVARSQDLPLFESLAIFGLIRALRDAARDPSAWSSSTPAHELLDFVIAHLDGPRPIAPEADTSTDEV